MRYANYFIIACILAIASCSLASSQGNLPNNFDVDETALERGLLVIHLPRERPRNLAIRTPAGEWFILQESTESIEIMPQVRFETMKKMEFEIDKLKAVTWRDSIRVTDLVFTTAGEYLVYFADNLETEPENTFSFQQTIRYKD